MLPAQRVGLDQQVQGETLDHPDHEACKVSQVLQDLMDKSDLWVREVMSAIPVILVLRVQQDAWDLQVYKVL